MSERLTLVSTLQWREVEGEIVALDVERSVYVSANRSAALMWQALSDGTTRGELVERLTGEFEIDREAAERDTDAFLAQLEQSAYLRRTS
jgi:hypothetical protein